MKAVDLHILHLLLDLIAKIALLSSALVNDISDDLAHHSVAELRGRIRLTFSEFFKGMPIEFGHKSFFSINTLTNEVHVPSVVIQELLAANNSA